MEEVVHDGLRQLTFLGVAGVLDRPLAIGRLPQENPQARGWQLI
jgi:hypothetical protein